MLLETRRLVNEVLLKFSNSVLVSTMGFQLIKGTEAIFCRFYWATLQFQVTQHNKVYHMLKQLTNFGPPPGPLGPPMAPSGHPADAGAFHLNSTDTPF